METVLLCHEIEKKLQCTINAAKVKSFCNSVRYMYAICIPCDMKEALKHYEENDNDNSKKTKRFEIQQVMHYDTFINQGLRNQMPNDYTKIRCCMIFTVKHNG